VIAPVTNWRQWGLGKGCFAIAQCG
jgi:hypothetical protein